MKKITIAIDGYSSCGKSTMAKDLAKEIGYIYIDSGAMYRAVTLYCLENQFFYKKYHCKTTIDIHFYILHYPNFIWMDSSYMEICIL